MKKSYKLVSAVNRKIKHIPYGSVKKGIDWVYIKGLGEFEVNVVNKGKIRQQSKKEIKLQLEEND